MNIKEIQPVTVAYKELRTNLLNISKYVGTEPDKLRKQIEDANLEITSPQIWEYIDVENDPEKEFTLRIAFPVNEKQSNNLTNIKKLESFTCAHMEHKGAWSDLKFSYEKLIGEIMQNGYKPTNYCREVYHVCDFENEENNITEIQVGIVQ